MIKNKLMVSNHYSSRPGNIVGNILLQVGRFLTYPVFQVANAVTKLASGHIRPGKNLDSPVNNSNKTPSLLLRKITKVAIVVVFIVPSLALSLIGIPLCIIGNMCCAKASMIKSSCPSKTYNPKEGLHIMTYNTGLMPNYIRNINDLRSSNTRAKEISENILHNQDIQPDIICFQEVFDRKASGHLLEKLKDNYSNIVYNVAPSEIGLNSGLAIASKFPILDVSFRKFKNLAGEDALSNKGILRAIVDLGNGKSATIYNTHLQAKTGEKYDNIRFEELTQIQQWISADSDVSIIDSEYESQGVFFMGDLNLSIADEEGKIKEDHSYEKGTFALGKEFHNSYYETHDIETANRNKHSASIFTDTSQPDSLLTKEPTGTWYEGAGSNNRNSWGSSTWKDNPKVAHNCIYDHQFIFDPNKQEKWASHAEIRHLTSITNTSQDSGLSDHLPMSVIYKEHAGFKDVLNELNEKYIGQPHLKNIQSLLENIEYYKNKNPFIIIDLHRKYILSIDNNIKNITNQAINQEIRDLELAHVDYIEESLRKTFKINK